MGRYTLLCLSLFTAVLFGACQSMLVGDEVEQASSQISSEVFDEQNQTSHQDLTTSNQSPTNTTGPVDNTDTTDTMNTVDTVDTTDILPQSATSTLDVGNGFSAPTAEPKPNGVGPKAIARWDVVPYQKFTEDFEVGVIAFHYYGISHVSISAAGGSWVNIPSMTLNPRTGVYEYWAKIPIDTTKKGPIELRAIAFTNQGEHRLLEPMWLYADPGGSQKAIEKYVAPCPVGMSQSQCKSHNASGTVDDPFFFMGKAIQAIEKEDAAGLDGHVVYLLAGDHVYGDVNGKVHATSNCWFTISGAPGTNAQEVRIVNTASDFPKILTKLIKFTNLTFYQQSVPVDTGTKVPEDYIFADGVAFVGKGQFKKFGRFFNVKHTTGFWVTNSTVSHSEFATEFALMNRNVHADHIGSDAFGGTRLLVNSSVTELDKHDPANPNPKCPKPPDYDNPACWHADVYDLTFKGIVENFIVFGLKAIGYDAQGIFADDGVELNNVAIVNVLLDHKKNGETGANRSQWGFVQTSHLLLWFITMNQQFKWRDPVQNYTYVSVRGNAFQNMITDHTFDTSGFADNHFVKGTFPGSNLTNGDWQIDMLQDQYVPPVTSPLVQNPVITDPLPLVPVDVNGNPRTHPSSRGAIHVAP